MYEGHKAAKELFRHAPENEQQAAMKAMGYYKASPGQVLMSQGCSGDVFYIILSGDLFVYVRSAEQQAQWEAETRRTLGIPEGAMPEARLHGPGFNGDKADGYAALGMCVVSLRRGQKVGEGALLTPERLRTASVMADPEHYVELIAVPGPAYRTLVSSVDLSQTELSQTVSFLQSWCIFSHWQQAALERFVGGLHRTTLHRGDVLHEEGEPSARRSSAEHLLTTKASCCTAPTLILIVAQCSAIP